MADFLKAYNLVRQYEGGYCNVKGDPGGETYAGIARTYWPNWPGWPLIDAAKKTPFYEAGSKVFSKDLDANPTLRAHVEEFYRREWWDRLGLDIFPQEISDEIFEQAINLGRSGAVKKVQLLCNALNINFKGQPIFPDLVIDGAIGRKTLNALEKLLLVYDPALIVNGLNALQAEHYIEIAAKNPIKRKFIRGWLARAVPAAPTLLEV